MLANTLNTNEVKNSSGTEVEFQSLGAVGRSHGFQQVAETPNAEHRLMVSHQEISTGLDKRRRSRVGFTKEVAGASGTKRTIQFYIVGDVPVGDLSTMAEPKNVLAELMSFVASLGASTTILYDCTGNGADCLINGGI